MGSEASLQNKQLVNDFLRLAWVDGDLELLSGMVTANFYYLTTFTDDILDLNKYIDFVQAFRDAMPDLMLVVEETMAEENRVMSHTSFSGIVEKPVFGIPASDRIIAFPAISLWDIRHDGKIASLNTLVDITGLSRQLGVNISPKDTLRKNI